MATHALKPVHSHNKMKLMIPIVVAGALLSSSVAAQADTGHRTTPATSVAQSVASQNATSFTRVALVTPDISAPATAKLSFEHSIVKTIAAPKPVVKPVVKVEGKKTTKVAVKVATEAATTTLTNPGNISTDLTAGTGASGSTGASDAFGAAIVKSVLSQLGRNQDCTALVSNSLAAVGINFHGWPKDYEQLGSLTTNPQPGDLIYYKDGGMGLPHIAVFLSPEKAVHGGWNGHTTAIGPVNLGSGPIYIHVNR